MWAPDGLFCAPGERHVKKLFGAVGSFVGSYAGWALGAPFGIFMAFMVGMVGTGVGLYAGVKLFDHFEL
jgi:hypothetical protein